MDLPSLMPLVDERNEWRKQMEGGVFETPYLLNIYESNRDSDLWRSTRAVEKLCEYILFLEDKLNERPRKPPSSL